jgi:hypothetical protein
MLHPQMPGHAMEPPIYGWEVDFTAAPAKPTNGSGDGGPDALRPPSPAMEGPGAPARSAPADSYHAAPPGRLANHYAAPSTSMSSPIAVPGDAAPVQAMTSAAEEPGAPGADEHGPMSGAGRPGPVLPEAMVRSLKPSAPGQVGEVAGGSPAGRPQNTLISIFVAVDGTTRLL